MYKFYIKNAIVCGLFFLLPLLLSVVKIILGVYTKPKLVEFLKSQGLKVQRNHEGS